MHGSSYRGDGGQALRDLAVVMREVLGPKAEEGQTIPADIHPAVKQPRPMAPTALALPIEVARP